MCHILTSHLIQRAVTMESGASPSPRLQSCKFMSITNKVFIVTWHFLCQVESVYKLLEILYIMFS